MQERQAPETIRLNSYYLQGPLYRSDTLIKQIVLDLKGIDFDTLVGRGLSGSLVVPIVARALSKSFMLVRKEISAHATWDVEGDLGRRWLFIDDLISSGETLRATKEAIEKVATRKAHATTFIGAYMYDSVVARAQAGVEKVDDLGGFRGAGLLEMFNPEPVIPSIGAPAPEETTMVIGPNGDYHSAMYG